MSSLSGPIQTLVQSACRNVCFVTQTRSWTPSETGAFAVSMHKIVCFVTQTRSWTPSETGAFAVSMHKIEEEAII